jgi:hypothetical protein
MHYQAVARDEAGNELTQKTIDVKFTILSGSPIGTQVYQELYPGVVTSKYGVFSLIIGKGTKTDPSGPDISQVPWDQANQWLRVEIDFGRGFINMGTMQFMAVPYAMYAYKSLEPGPMGPQGPPGDPASDKQTLSFDGSILSISNGNTVDLGTLNVPHSLSILGDTLSIFGGNKVELPDQIQDLTLDASNILKITKNSTATPIDLSKYLDNTDSQTLLFNPANNNLTISGGNAVDLTPMKQNLSLNGNILTLTNVSNPVQVDLTKYLDNTDSQQLSYDPATYTLSLTNGGSVTLVSAVAFRAGINASYTLPNNVVTDLVFDQTTGSGYFNDGSNYNSTTNYFQAGNDGIYTFTVAINIPNSTTAYIKLNGSIFETLLGPTSASGLFRGTITMKLSKNDIVTVAILQTSGYQFSPTITGSFSGFRVY